MSTAPAPIEYTLDNIEHAVSRTDGGDGSKALCVASAVERHIRKEYTEEANNDDEPVQKMPATGAEHCHRNGAPRNARSSSGVGPVVVLALLALLGAL